LFRRTNPAISHSTSLDTLAIRLRRDDEEEIAVGHSREKYGGRCEDGLHLERVCYVVYLFVSDFFGGLFIRMEEMVKVNGGSALLLAPAGPLIHRCRQSGFPLCLKARDTPLRP
jgi:hypothetical protein